MAERTRLLITGATGFIGRHCLARLGEPNAAQFDEIHAVARRPGSPASGVVWHSLDLLDGVGVRDLVARVRPTHLLHAAWIATPGVYITSPENIDWLGASLTLFRAFGENGGVRAVGVGTSAEYGEEPHASHEATSLIAPQSVYGKCKAGCAQGFSAIAQYHGFSAAWARLFLPYGPGDAAQRLIPSVTAQLLTGAEFRSTHGRQQRDFIFAPDAADLIVRLLGSDLSGALNVGTGLGASVRQVIETLARLTGSTSDLKFGAIEMRPGDPAMLVADMSRARRELGWLPSTTLEAGLAAVVAAARQRP